ncbi:Fungal specific transcription factor [Pleurostoma richardsiae]|uniref:Fungal specific transcription factor n=1 Tax=Pleurostoma richardsiae TaxID=41990 RepID=A0AA38RFM9_9PEZI|nr:Fungal specific transcription factor [Pleurostoma richardsiae]
MASSNAQAVERSKALGRRKACDLCRLKKIKCDAKKPKCSHCTIYNKDCIWTPGLPKKKGQVKDAEKDSASRFAYLEERLASLEAQLRRGPIVTPESSEQDDDLHVVDAPEDDEEAEAPTLEPSLLIETGDSMVDCPPVLVHTSSFPLPPLQEVLPLIEDYFTKFNHFVPLFHQTDFMRMLQGWYSNPLQRDDATWACINVAMALSLHQCPYHRPFDRDEWIQRCTANAQSVMNNLVTRDRDLKGVQVLLGLVMLFLSSVQPRPACVLIATAVKLAHRLRLHTRRGRERLDPQEATQRDRVFWIAYVLDKDISMRAVEPYVQRDDDIDTDLPAAADPDDRTGFVLSGDGETWFNIFWHRIHIARIQGKVYDMTYSVRGERVPEREKLANAARLDHMIQDWRRGIPEEFQPEKNMDTIGNLVGMRHFISLYFTYYQCVFMAHRVHSRDADWLKRLTDYSQRFAIGHDHRQNRGEARGGSPLPPRWLEFVETARACMKTFRSVYAVGNRDSALLWSMTCPYLSSIVILVAHKLTIAEHVVSEEDLAADEELIEGGLGYLKWRLEDPCNDIILRDTHMACSELNARATVAITDFRLKEAERAADDSLFTSHLSGQTFSLPGFDQGIYGTGPGTFAL